MRRIDANLQQLDRVSAYLAEDDSLVDRRSDAVSGWSVGQQLEHVVHVIEACVERILEAPEALSRGVSWKGRLMLTLGRFPRGVAQSPAQFRGRQVSAAALRERVARLRGRFAELTTRTDLLERPDPAIPHHIFGGLSADRGLRLTEVHTAHHLAIVRDILRR